MSFSRHLLRNLDDAWNTLRRQSRRFLKSPRLALEYWRYRGRLGRCDWPGIKEMLDATSQWALQAGDFRFVSELGYAALRLDEPHLGMQLLSQARIKAGTAGLNEWRGEDIGDATLLIELMESRRQAVTAGINMAGHIRAAAARAAKTILVVEPRMVPIFRRTLPEIVVVPFGADIAGQIEGRVVTADTIGLAAVLGYDKGTIRSLYVPLVSDEDSARVIRDRYLKGRSLPLIGIAWWSSHVGKDLPSVADWSRLVRDLPAQFVSLQYAQDPADVAVLQGAQPDKFIVDPDIDQLRDMDRFASQIAALDLVVTISNSGAHLAGAMGQKTVLVRDDLFRRVWPHLSREVPWYPNTIVIGKDSRDWSDTFGEVVAAARDLTRSKS